MGVMNSYYGQNKRRELRSVDRNRSGKCAVPFSASLPACAAAERCSRVLLQVVRALGRPQLEMALCGSRQVIGQRKMIIVTTLKTDRGANKRGWLANILAINLSNWHDLVSWALGSCRLHNTRWALFQLAVDLARHFVHTIPM